MGSVPSATECIKIASASARHFGFRPLEEIAGDSRLKGVKKVPITKIMQSDRKLDGVHGILTSGISSYFENNLHSLSEPALFSTFDEMPRTGDITIGLHVIGIKKSIAEALLIQSIRSLFNDFGFDRTMVRINSLGDQDSINRYARELAHFYRRQMDDMPPTARELMKKHVFEALWHLLEKEHELGRRSPSPLEYLSDESRRHFREIIEYLDMSSAAYEIDNRLLGNHQCYSDAIFSVDALDGESMRIPEAPIYARGGRYDEFVRRLTKQKVPALGAVITLRERKTPSRIPQSKKAHPSLFVIQLGFGPKIRSLLLLDTLKQAGFGVHQELSSDSLSEQLRRAETCKVPYSLILGQKEYVEGTIIVRDMNSRSQESIRIEQLVPYLKKVDLK